jgi:uncharacterized membrane-anchored protein
MPFRISLRTRVSTSLQAISALPLAAVLSLALAADADAQDADSRREQFNSIEWVDAPGVGKLGKYATLDIPEGCRFTEAKGAKKFMELTENPVSGAEVGALTCETPTPGNPTDPEVWFVIFEYDPSGYVKDTEKASLDADKILASLREGQAQGNVERRRRGWDELEIGGWVRPPYYDEETNNLTWSVSVLATGDTSVNHSVRLLGRGGVLKADLVSDPSGFELAMPTFTEVVDGTIFVPGQKYSEWRDGDKVAKYGLTALVAGGAGAAAVKLGLFGKLWKVIAASGKLIIVGIVAVGAWLKKLVTGKSDDRSPSPSSGS